MTTETFLLDFTSFLNTKLSWWCCVLTPKWVSSTPLTSTPDLAREGISWLHGQVSLSDVWLPVFEGGAQTWSSLYLPVYCLPSIEKWVQPVDRWVRKCTLKNHMQQPWIEKHSSSTQNGSHFLATRSVFHIPRTLQLHWHLEVICVWKKW